MAALRELFGEHDKFAQAFRRFNAPGTFSGDADSFMPSFVCRGLKDLATYHTGLGVFTLAIEVSARDDRHLFLEIVAASIRVQKFARNPAGLIVINELHD